MGGRNCREGSPMRTARRGITRWELILLLVLLIVVAVMIGPAVQQPYDVDWPRRKCQNNLKMFGLALHNYHNRHGSFPPAVIQDEYGNRLHSWRTVLLPDVDGMPLYTKYRFDQPWNSPHNRDIALGARIPGSIGQCDDPSKPTPPVTLTNYLAVIGPHTAWRTDRPVRLDEVTDGTDRSILLVEVANSDINWFEPRDLEWDQLSFKLNDPAVLSPGSRHVRPGGLFSGPVPYVNVLLVDGSVRKLPLDTPPETLKALLTIDGGETIDLPWLE